MATHGVFIAAPLAVGERAAREEHAGLRAELEPQARAERAARASKPPSSSTPRSWRCASPPV